MSKLWRCYNCPLDTGAEWHEWQGLPKCPKCGLSQTDKPGGELVVERTAIHFDPPHPLLKGKGTNKRACDSKSVGIGSATGVALSVTCPECLKTDAYKTAAELQGTLVTTAAEADFVVQGPTQEASTHGS